MKPVKGMENLVGRASGIGRQFGFAAPDRLSRADALIAEGRAAARAKKSERIDLPVEELVEKGKALRAAGKGLDAPIADQDGVLPAGAINIPENIPEPANQPQDSGSADRRKRWREANREKLREKERERYRLKKAMENSK